MAKGCLVDVAHVEAKSCTATHLHLIDIIIVGPAVQGRH